MSTPQTSENTQDSISACPSLTESANLQRDISKLSLLSTSSTISDDEHFRFVGHAEHSMICMQNYLQAGKLCDVTLVAGTNGLKVQAHRLVLSAASEYFSVMFTGNLRESEQTEITLKDVSGNVLEAVVNYCYTGTIEIREDNVETLLETACLMQLHEVVEACARYLAIQLHPSNCLGIALFAEHQSCNSLFEKSKAYISKYFMQVIQNQEFLQLTLDQVIKLLGMDDLNIFSEEHIFHALMSWVQHDSSNRKPDLKQLLKLIRLPLINPSFLSDQVEPAIGDDSECQKLLTEAYKWHLLPERRSQIMTDRTRPRKATMGKLLVIGGMDTCKGGTTIECYHPRINTWTSPYNMSGRRLQFGVGMMGDKLIVVGGRDGLKTLNSMESLDLETGNWTQLSSMNTHRHGLGVAILGGPLYAVGGHDGWSYLNTVERWDPVSKSWSYVAPMNNQRCSAGVAVVNGKLYAVGGRDGAACLNSVECYDPYTNKWTMCASLSKRRGGIGVAEANGFLYAIGGQDAPSNNPAACRFDCVERYDPCSNTWTTIASISSKRDAVSACLFGDCIVAIGGYDGNKYLNIVERYDPISNIWQPLASLNSCRAGACVINVDNNIVEISPALKE